LQGISDLTEDIFEGSYRRGKDYNISLGDGLVNVVYNFPGYAQPTRFLACNRPVAVTNGFNTFQRA
jgi:hypothetical protein